MMLSVGYLTSLGSRLRPCSTQLRAVARLPWSTAAMRSTRAPATCAFVTVPRLQVGEGMRNECVQVLVVSFFENGTAFAHGFFLFS